MDLLKPMSESEAAKWEKICAGREWLYVLRSAIFWFVLIVLARISIDLLFGDHLASEVSILVTLAFLSLMFGLTDWWATRSRYQTHLLKKKVEKGS